MYMNNRHIMKTTTFFIISILVGTIVSAQISTIDKGFIQENSISISDAKYCANQFLVIKEKDLDYTIDAYE